LRSSSFHRLKADSESGLQVAQRELHGAVLVALLAQPFLKDVLFHRGVILAAAVANEGGFDFALSVDPAARCEHSAFFFGTQGATKTAVRRRPSVP
jgi:hypothetical protein